MVEAVMIQEFTNGKNWMFMGFAINLLRHQLLELNHHWICDIL